MTKIIENSGSEMIQPGNITTFPYQVFPTQICQIMEAYHCTLGFSYDYMAAAILYANSLAIGRAVRLKVKKGWFESPVLYIATCGKAGVGKTAPLATFLAPFLEKDKESFKVYQSERLEYSQKIQEENKKAKGEKNKEPFYLSEPIRKQYLFSDFTVESLVVGHNFNQQGIGIYSDELLQFIENLGRYTKSGEEQFYLSCWSSRDISINRKTQPSILISNPFINIIGSIQTDLIPYALGKNRQKSGFTHRFLFLSGKDN